jgi:hypothetical protein
MKEFEEYLQEGVVRRISKDVNRARFLLEESEKREDFIKVMVENIKISEENANYFVENCYNVISELIRAKMLMDGYSASGMGSHEAEVSYMRVLNMDNGDIEFMNDLRYFRNGIHYYGKGVDKEYAQKVLNFIKKLSPKIKKMIKQSF